MASYAGAKSGLADEGMRPVFEHRSIDFQPRRCFRKEETSCGTCLDWREIDLALHRVHAADDHREYIAEGIAFLLPPTVEGAADGIELEEVVAHGADRDRSALHDVREFDEKTEGADIGDHGTE